MYTFLRSSWLNRFISIIEFYTSTWHLYSVSTSEERYKMKKKVQNVKIRVIVNFEYILAVCRNIRMKKNISNFFSILQNERKREIYFGSSNFSRKCEKLTGFWISSFWFSFFLFLHAIKNCPILRMCCPGKKLVQMNSKCLNEMKLLQFLYVPPLGDSRLSYVEIDVFKNMCANIFILINSFRIDRWSSVGS